MHVAPAVAPVVAPAVASIVVRLVIALVVMFVVVLIVVIFIVGPSELKGCGQKPGAVSPQVSKMQSLPVFRKPYTNELTQQPTSAIRLHSFVLQESV